MVGDYRAGHNDDMRRYGTDIGRIVRIQDSVGEARTVTLDYGCLDIALRDSAEEHRKD